MGSEITRCTKLTKRILIQKSEATGISGPKLLEFAVLNMPYLPKNELKKLIKK